MALTPDGIAPPGIPLLGCSPPTTMRYRTVFGGRCNTLTACNLRCEICMTSKFPHQNKYSIAAAAIFHSFCIYYDASYTRHSLRFRQLQYTLLSLTLCNAVL